MFATVKLSQLHCILNHYSTEIPRVEAAGNLSVVVGHSAYLSCKVESIPPHTTVTWFYSPNKENTSVSNTTFLRVNTENATKYEGGEIPNPSLYIRHVDKADEGYYVCTAANEGGTGISKGTMHVTVLAGMFILWDYWSCGKKGNIGFH